MTCFRNTRLGSLARTVHQRSQTSVDEPRRSARLSDVARHRLSRSGEDLSRCPEEDPQRRRCPSPFVPRHQGPDAAGLVPPELREATGRELGLNAYRGQYGDAHACAHAPLYGLYALELERLPWHHARLRELPLEPGAIRTPCLRRLRQEHGLPTQRLWGYQGRVSERVGRRRDDAYDLLDQRLGRESGDLYQPIKDECHVHPTFFERLPRRTHEPTDGGRLERYPHPGVAFVEEG